MLSLSCHLFACGGATEPASQGTPTTPTSSTSVSTNNLILNYLINLQIDSPDDDWDFSIALPASYQMGLFLENNGDLSVLARDIPKMVYRVCAIGSKATGCHAYSDKIDDMDIDIVIDACGRFVSDSLCGDADDTEFLGRIEPNGSMLISNLSIRIRTFLITNTLNGYLADAADEGLVVMKRLILSLTTEAVSSGSLTTSGVGISNKNVQLVAAGVFSTLSEGFTGSDYLVTINGTFNKNPATLLQ